MKALLLLGGTDEQNGDYSLLRDTAERRNGRTPPWGALKDAVAGDELWFYFPRPFSAITAHGIAANDAQPGDHWPYAVEVKKVTWLPSPVTLSELRQRFPHWTWARNARNGTHLPLEVARFLKRQAKSVGRPKRGEAPTMLPEEQEFHEGHSVRVAINRYERDGNARAACLAKQGSDCSICGIGLQAVYGPQFRGLVHVHHVVPLSQAGGAYRVDPATNLIPVCPNCHAVIHSRVPALTPNEVRTLMRKQRGNGRPRRT
jgi:hypothetical protein